MKIADQSTYHVPFLRLANDSSQLLDEHSVTSAPKRPEFALNLKSSPFARMDSRRIGPETLCDESGYGTWKGP